MARTRASARRGVALLVAALAGALSLAACSSGETHKKKHPAQTVYTAWNPPLGDPIQGLTLHDGWEDLREVPSPVNVTGGWTDSVAVTPDGLHLYFGYSRYDFTEFFKSVKLAVAPVFDPTGPVRPGMTGDVFKVFRADLDSTGGWIVTYHPVNDADPNQSEASASPNAAGDLLAWTRFDAGGNGVLWYSSYSGSAWGAPIDLTGAPIPINAGCGMGGDDNAFLIGDLSTSVTLTWESHRDASVACGSERHLFQSTYTAANDSWSAITPVPGLNVFGGSDDSQVSFSPDGATAYWTSVRYYNSVVTYGIFTAEWDGSSYTNVHPLATPTLAPGPFTNQVVIQGELNVAEFPEGWRAYLMCGTATGEGPDMIVLKVCTMRKLK